MTQNEFHLKQQAAVERMREMNSQSKFKDENSSKKSTEQPNINTHTEKRYNNRLNAKESMFNMNIFDIFSKDSDTALIIGLLLILMNEKSDKLLLFALIYILM